MARSNHNEDIQRQLAEQQASVRAFRHPAELIEPEERECHVTKMADALTPVLRFIARGRSGGTMAIRSWIFLHETRLDMIAGESIEACAKREGVSAQRVHELIKEFRACVPNYRAPNQKSGETKARMAAAQRRRHTPGKESFSGSTCLAGSADAPHSTTGGV